ncbi:MAG: helix-turn-helix domain-containing protein [Candidatus Kapaibacteriales bacterium]
MKHISILIPQGYSIVDTIIAPYNLLKMANSYHQHFSKSDAPLYEIDLIGVDKEDVTYQRLFTIRPTASIESITKTDLIIVTPISGDMIKGINENQEFIKWIREQRIENDAEIASLCKGAFLLAETGLMSGKNCSTHWTEHHLFKERYPRINLLPESIITEDNGIYSSGGAYSILNFILYLIERKFGRETAIWVAKNAEIDLDRIKQTEFIIFNGQKDHSDHQVKTVQEYIENYYSIKLSVDLLAKLVHVNPRSLLRRFKKVTFNTPLEYIQRVRIEAAKRRLESSTQTVQEVMFEVGYNDEKAFRNVFKKYSGLSPKKYQIKYNREMAKSFNQIGGI